MRASRSADHRAHSWARGTYSTPVLLPWGTGLLVFFQAEDGIRDRNVTGVQTCALPIFSNQYKINSVPSPDTIPSRWFGYQKTTRSEERRVGKECRSRRTPYHAQKKEQSALQITRSAPRAAEERA